MVETQFQSQPNLVPKRMGHPALHKNILPFRRAQQISYPLSPSESSALQSYLSLEFGGRFARQSKISFDVQKAVEADRGENKVSLPS